MAKVIKTGDALWSIDSTITKEIARLTADDYTANEDRIMQLRELKSNLIDFEEGYNVPQTAHVNLEVVEVFAEASNTLPASWKSANQRRMANPINRDNPYTEVLRVRPVIASEMLAPFLQRGQTQFPLTKKQIAQIRTDGIEVLDGQLYKFNVEFWKRNKTEYIRVSEDYDSLEDFEKVVADNAGFNGLFTIEKHRRNGLSFKGVEVVNIEILEAGAAADAAEAEMQMASNKKKIASIQSRMTDQKMAIMTKIEKSGIDSLSANELAIVQSM